MGFNGSLAIACSDCGGVTLFQHLFTAHMIKHSIFKITQKGGGHKIIDHMLSFEFLYQNL